MFAIARPRWLSLLLMALPLLSVSSAHADWVLDLGPSFDVRVVGRDDFSAQRTTYEMIIRNYTTTTYDCTGRIGYYRLDTGSTVAGTSGQGVAPPDGPWQIVASTVAWSEKLATGYDYLTVSCTPRTTGGAGGGAGGGGGGTGGTQLPRFGNGTLGYTLSQTSNTVDLRVARVENLSGSRTTGTLLIELWALNVPYNRNVTSGYRMASSRLPSQCGDPDGRLGPGVPCDNIRIPAAALTVPPPGTYTAVYFLKERQSTCTDPSGYCIVDWFNFNTNALTINPNNTVPTPQGLSLTGASFTLNFNSNTASFAATQLKNNSTNATARLNLELWLTPEPYTGSAFSGYKLLATDLPVACGQQLAAGATCNNISYSSSLLANVPDGTYYITLFVTQQTPTCQFNGNFCVSTAVALGTGTKTTTTGGGGTGAGGDGNDGGGSSGGGAMSGELVLGLGLLTVFSAYRRSRKAAHGGALCEWLRQARAPRRHRTSNGCSA
jgi:hypothetical protein